MKGKVLSSKEKKPLEAAQSTHGAKRASTPRGKKSPGLIPNWPSRVPQVLHPGIFSSFGKPQVFQMSRSCSGSSAPEKMTDRVFISAITHLSKRERQDLSTDVATWLNLGGTHPADHISMLGPYFRRLRMISGARYQRVTTMFEYVMPSSPSGSSLATTNLAMPKSPM